MVLGLPGAVMLDSTVGFGWCFSSSWGHPTVPRRALAHPLYRRKASSTICGYCVMNECFAVIVMPPIVWRPIHGGEGVSCLPLFGIMSQLRRTTFGFCQAFSTSTLPQRCTHGTLTLMRHSRVTNHCTCRASEDWPCMWCLEA